jgi:pimeloyl-ACP methyl ester carboxylesterase
MARRVGPLTAETVQGEGAKFTAPLLLVHGLWSDARIWRRFVGFLSHRGWTCIAVNLRGRDGSPPVASVAEHLDDLKQVMAALEAPPVVVGHDLGGLLALHLSGARAVVALAPLVPLPLAPTPAPALRRAGNVLSRWRGQPLTPPRGSWRDDYVAQPSAREPSIVVRELMAKPWMPAALPADVPGLVLGRERDRIVDPELAAKLAVAAGAEFQLCAGDSHAMMTDAGWEERVSIVHRWLIRTLGAPLLALYEEAMNPED